MITVADIVQQGDSVIHHLPNNLGVQAGTVISIKGQAVTLQLDDQYNSQSQAHISHLSFAPKIL